MYYYRTPYAKTTAGKFSLSGYRYVLMKDKLFSQELDISLQFSLRGKRLRAEKFALVA